ncbi:hypothetical protein O1Q96_22645 [Streptomyces sp. Qhu-G9]|uniref:hypothetical protein n=1 Tax=Streptomyces sp. Qhu-G9 TaxID=3452799 RepID=UPI0022AC03A9|nr:hypothetical protein [Streptomyces aurantiacus]WAU82309.1 hypothetical protein O1Q96_22645 [Streptomyces aurantiacus]
MRNQPAEPAPAAPGARPRTPQRPFTAAVHAAAALDETAAEPPPQPASHDERRTEHRPTEPAPHNHGVRTTRTHGGTGVKAITLAGGLLPELNPARMLEAAL